MENWLDLILPILGIAAGLAVKVPFLQKKLAKARAFGEDAITLFKVTDNAFKADSLGGESVVVEEMAEIGVEAKEAWSSLKALIAKEEEEIKEVEEK